jgi:hypothetical protein
MSPIGQRHTLCVGSGLLLGLGALDCAFGHCCERSCVSRVSLYVKRKERLLCIAIGGN